VEHWSEGMSSSVMICCAPYTIQPLSTLSHFCIKEFLKAIITFNQMFSRIIH
jgi:hypothetical protein